MRLLSTKEVKKASTKQKDRGNEIDRYISSKTKELNEYKDKYQKQKQTILDDFIAYSEEIAGQKAKLEGKFTSLEERKGMAFKSLSELSAKAEKKLEKAQNIEVTFDIRERNLEAREKNVKNDTDLNNKREKTLNEIATDLSERKNRLDKYDNDLQKRANEISAKLQEREDKISKKEKKIDEHLEELRLGIEANDNMADLLELREKRFDKYVEEQERLIQDKRDTLNRGFNELSTLKAKYGNR